MIWTKGALFIELIRTLSGIWDVRYTPAHSVDGAGVHHANSMARSGRLELGCGRPCVCGDVAVRLLDAKYEGALDHGESLAARRCQNHGPSRILAG